MTELIGFLGGLFFALSAIPLAYEAVKTKRVDAPWTSIRLIAAGSVCMLVYAWLIEAIPLVCDMVITSTCWTIIGIVKLKEEKR